MVQHLCGGGTPWVQMWPCGRVTIDAACDGKGAWMGWPATRLLSSRAWSEAASPASQARRVRLSMCKREGGTTWRSRSNAGGAPQNLGCRPSARRSCAATDLSRPGPFSSAGTRGRPTSAAGPSASSPLPGSRRRDSPCCGRGEGTQRHQRRCPHPARPNRPLGVKFSRGVRAQGPAHRQIFGRHCEL